MDFRLEGRRIAVALSGGVDSALVAALLKDAGADLFALTMRVQNKDDARDACALAAFLDIPHTIVDLRATFRSCVIDPFVEAYLCGKTPNPCAVCNRTVKFGALADLAKNMGAQGFATGHYARKIESITGSELHRGLDSARDQSYFLFDLSLEQLAFSLFPLGALSKKDVRAQAKDRKLPVANKKDSQDICFVPEGDYLRVLEEHAPNRAVPGAIVDMSGTVLGAHRGIAGFTVGQRKGLGLGACAQAQTSPLYVIKIDSLRNEVTVGPKEALLNQEIFIKDINWLAEDVPSEGMRVDARVRSTQPLVSARFFKNGRHGKLVFDAPISGACPGQAAVVYHKDRVLGGGWIEREA